MKGMTTTLSVSEDRNKTLDFNLSFIYLGSITC